MCPTYSIYIIGLNKAKTIRASLDSILEQIDDRFEVIVVIKRQGIHPERQKLLKKLSMRMEQYLDRYRLGRRVFTEGERVNIFQRVVQLSVGLMASFMKSYKDDFNACFEPYNESYYIPYSDKITTLDNEMTKAQG